MKVLSHTDQSDSTVLPVTASKALLASTTTPSDCKPQYVMSFDLGGLFGIESRYRLRAEQA